MKNAWRLDPVYFAPHAKAGGGWIAFKDAPSPPPAPDYGAMAVQQGQANIDAARTSAKLSNPNITSPLGSRTITYGGGAPTFNQAGFDSAMKAYTEGLRSGGSGQPQWGATGGYETDGGPAMGWVTPQGQSGGSELKAPNQADFWQTSGDPDQSNMDIRLSPEQQRLYDQQARLSQGVGNVAESQLGRVADSVSQPFSYGGQPERVTRVGSGDANAARDATTRAIIERNQPRMDRARAAQDTQLANQGIMRGSEAYENAQDDLARAENDFRLGAIREGNAEQNQIFGQEMQNAALQNTGRAAGIQEQSYLRGLPLSEFNSFRTGAQPTMPQFQNYSGVSTQPAPIMQAGMAQNQYDMGLYNSQVAGQNSTMNGLFGLGGAALKFGMGGPAGLAF